MKYFIFVTLKDIPESMKNSIESLSPVPRGIIVPVSEGIPSNYIYIREDLVPEVTKKLRGLLSFTRLKQYVSEEDALSFLLRVDTDNLMKPGEYVQVSGYGKMVFVIDSYVNNSEYRVHSALKDTRVELVVKGSQIKKHPNPSYFLFSDTVDPELKGTLVIDSDYFDQFVEPPEFLSALNLLIRLKVQFRGLEVCFSFTDGIQKHLLDLVNLFGLKYSFNGLAIGDYLFSDKLYYLKCFDGVSYIEEDQVTLLTADRVDRNKFSYYHYLIELNRKGVIGGAFSKESIKFFIENSDWQTIRERFSEWDSELSAVDVLKNRLVSPISTEFVPERVVKEMRAKGQIWFIENANFFISTIRK